MKALILNSGMGSRMGVLTSEHPKCMTEISSRETILSRQLRQLAEMDITEVIITTGQFDSVLVNYCHGLNLPLRLTFVKNPIYDKSNYIYSIYCAREYLNDDIILMHGDLVFENAVIDRVMELQASCMVVSSTLPLPQKDFKAVVKNGYVTAVGIDFFNDALAAQPLYKLRKDDWMVWLGSITRFCESGSIQCYAENAFNEVSNSCKIAALDVENMLCAEVDTPEDLAVISSKAAELDRHTVYMGFSTDVIHSGHIAIIKKAQRLGRLIVGVLSDEAIVGYKRFSLLPFAERKAMFENIVGVWKVVEQKKISYRENLESIRPTYVVHGDDWMTGPQRPVRDEVVEVLASYGGKLVEFPYSKSENYDAIERRIRAELALPDVRRARLRKSIERKGLVTAIEAHNGLTGLIAEKTIVYQNGEASQFDAMWISSLCDSTAKGKPDIELVDMTSRFRTIDDVMEVTTKPVIFDGDTGGLTEHFVYTVRTLERIGVSAVIIEDKIGLKRNSLFGTEADQQQDSIANFCHKIREGKRALKTKDFMIIARIESLILEQGMEDALERAFAYIEAGAGGIMIHSRRKEPNEIFEFCRRFREKNRHTVLVVVPTSFNAVTEDEWKRRGVNVVIYANHLIRSSYPIMQRTAETILRCRRAKEADEQFCMPIKDILALIPEE